jgi:DNA-binding protein
MHKLLHHVKNVFENVLEILLQWSKLKDKVVNNYRGQARRTPRTKQQSTAVSRNVTIEQLNEHLDDKVKFENINIL